MTNIRPFHVAFPVHNLEVTRKFYSEVLGCKIGRSAERWIDFDLYGHQISAHLVEGWKGGINTNPVDGKNVPVLHWGVILEMNQWEALAERLKKHGVKFIIEPYIRFKGELGEQATMFFMDLSGNALEFKAFKSDNSIFKSS
ncbi:MAG TPA: VOC family protein [Bacteroidia bacterium]|jgi:extradiol dioxygenase family protein|nr:VOC family protein [Bacteroidia bacterium]